MDVINHRPGSKRRYSAGMNQQDLDAYGQGLRPQEAPYGNQCRRQMCPVLGVD